MAYLWFSTELGDRSDGDPASPIFRNRFHKLATLSGGNRVVMMCAEENPLHCHRKNLLTKPLSAERVEIVHIRGRGSLDEDRNTQFLLFEDG